MNKKYFLSGIFFLVICIYSVIHLFVVNTESWAWMLLVFSGFLGVAYIRKSLDSK